MATPLMPRWNEIEAKAVAKTNNLIEALQAYGYRGHELEVYSASPKY